MGQESRHPAENISWRDKAVRRCEHARSMRRRESLLEYPPCLNSTDTCLIPSSFDIDNLILVRSSNEMLWMSSNIECVPKHVVVAYVAYHASYQGINASSLYCMAWYPINTVTDNCAGEGGIVQAAQSCFEERSTPRLLPDSYHRFDNRVSKVGKRIVRYLWWSEDPRVLKMDPTSVKVNSTIL